MALNSNMDSSCTILARSAKVMSTFPFQRLQYIISLLTAMKAWYACISFHICPNNSNFFLSFIVYCWHGMIGDCLLWEVVLNQLWPDGKYGRDVSYRIFLGDPSAFCTHFFLVKVAKPCQRNFFLVFQLSGNCSMLTHRVVVEITRQRKKRYIWSQRDQYKCPYLDAKRDSSGLIWTAKSDDSRAWMSYKRANHESKVGRHKE